MNIAQHTIFLLINNATDRQLLRDFLEDSGYLIKTAEAILAEDWLQSSMIVTDEFNARKLGQDLLIIKKQSGPLFVPLIILLPPKKNSTPWLKIGFDEALRLPLIKTEFLSKLNALSRLRAQSEIQYRLIFEHINLGIYRLSSDNHIVLANRSFANTMGYNSPSEIINKSLTELKIIVKPNRKNFLEELKSTGKIVGYESVWQIKENQKLYVRENAIVFKNDENEEYYYASTIEDITHRKLAEDALKISEEKHKQLIEYLPYGLLIQAEGQITFINQAMANMLHVNDRSQLIGKPFLDLVHPSDHVTLLQQMDFSKKLAHLNYTIKQKLVAINGQIINVELIAYPILYEGKQAVQFIAHNISSHVRAEKQIEYMAYHDPLTGLINRTKLEKVITELIQDANVDKKKVAVIFMDLDRFKTVNDALGHNYGDLVLCEIAKRLKKIIRFTDIIARIGGDEFIIVTNNIPDVSANPPLIIKKIIKALSKPFALDHHKLHLTTSIGVSIYPTDGEDGATLIKNADIAMYSAKECGKNNFQLFTNQMAKHVMHKAELEGKMLDALTNNELHVYYQPKIILSSEQMNGAEALLRWHHPIDGDIKPDKFIPLAEETGLIIPITKMVFEQVCKQINIWNNNFPPVDIAINFSARLFMDPDLIKDITAILKKYNVSPQNITLEMTEGVLFQDIGNNMHIIQKLKEIGMKISIDDFGTGYSSLHYLRRFIIDSLKIDLSFVKDITTDFDDALIVKTIIAMAHSLNIKVIAEGVETKEQLQLLRDYDCDEAQGFYFSPALPKEELTKFMCR